MGLIIKLEKIAEAQDNKSASFKEATGAYHATNNPGGYGAPNPLYTDIKGGVLQITNLKTDGVSYVEFSDVIARTFANPAVQSPIVVDSYDVGQSALGEDLEEINDGTFQFKYMPIIVYGIAMGFTSGSTVVTGLTLNTVFAEYSHILVSGKIYEIDKLNGFGSASMNIKTPFTGTTGEHLSHTGPMGVLKFGLIGVSNNKLLTAIGKIKSSGSTEELMDVLLLKFGADAKEGTQDIVGYQKIVDGLNSYFRTGIPCSK